MQPLTDRLAKLDTCAVSDALDRAGLAGAITALRPLTVPGKMVGRAVTVEVGPAQGPPSGRHLCAAAVDAVAPGDVIVVANGGRTELACWGGLLSLGASRRGAAGVIVDGAPRDVDEAREYALPIYARAATPKAGRGHLMEVAWNEPVQVAGVRVSPGDWVIADGSGVCIVSTEHAERVINAAEEIARRISHSS